MSRSSTSTLLFAVTCCKNRRVINSGLQLHEPHGKSSQCRHQQNDFRKLSITSNYVSNAISNWSTKEQTMTRRHQSSSRLPPSQSQAPLTAATALTSEDEHSIPTSMKNAKTLDEVLASIAEQTLAEEERRSVDKPTPWFSLLHYPSRAAWRSSDHILGSPHDDDDDDDDGDDGDDEVVNSKQGSRRNNTNNHRMSLLAQTQFNLLQNSQRTNKQLKRTYKRIMDTHSALANERERERRLAANLTPSSIASGSVETEGFIEDGRGRHVGDWREKNKREVTTAAKKAYFFDDPSVALSLSMGLYSSTNAYYYRRSNISISSRAPDYFGDKKLNIKTDEDEGVDTSASMNIRSPQSIHKLAKSKNITSANALKPVGYGREQAMTNVKYRLGPNYSIVRRVLVEVQSLLGGSKGETGSFQPRRVLDFGSGVGSASAAALDVFGVSRRSSVSQYSGIDWIHSIDASQSMRESTENVLRSILEGVPWEDGKLSDDKDIGEETKRTNSDPDNEEESLESEKDRKRLDRQRKRMEKWEQTWNKRADALTRLTFGESITDVSSSVTSISSRRVNDNNTYTDGEHSSIHPPPLPWQQQLDEQREKIAMKKEAKSSSSSSKTSKLLNGGNNAGSFDLILCSYTLSELTSVPSSLAAATLLWEKLAPDGVLVFVEPGTPDGFGTLRSIRSMLLECCPPAEVKERKNMLTRKRPTTKGEIIDERTCEGLNSLNIDADDTNDNTVSSDKNIHIHDLIDDWPEECHVLAPCTHNGTCPMSRHQINHVKRNSRFDKYEVANPVGEENADNKEWGKTSNSQDDDDTDDDNGIEEGTFQELVDGWDNLSMSDKEELKMMLGGGEDLTDDEAKAMLQYMDSIDDDDDDDDDEDEDAIDGEEDDADDDSEGECEEYEGKDNEDFNEGRAVYRNDGDGTRQKMVPIVNYTSRRKNKKQFNLQETEVFGSSYCSFVHSFPGGTSRRKGEKFSYLVLQKRIANADKDGCFSTLISDSEKKHPDPPLIETNIVDMLSQSVYHAQKLKKEVLREQLWKSGVRSNDNTREDTSLYQYHGDKYKEILQQAVNVENEFLESSKDSLGLEMLHGDVRRKSWGRLIRAPLKRKGHVLLDYCSAGCAGGDSSNCSVKDNTSMNAAHDNNYVDGSTQGRIIRQKVSRGWSTRSAPGCYSAARKARWGGFWPDLSKRLDQAQKEEEY